MIDWLKKTAALSVVALVAACGGSDDPPTADIVETARATAQFSTLVEAVVAADLATTLSGPGPFTLFAPTDDAFAALLADLGVTKAQLLADKALLTSVLTYHVLPAQVLKIDIPVGKAITTVEGGVFKIDPVGADLTILDGRNRSSRITAADVRASNGVIHAVDKVLLRANRNIVETAVASPSFSVLADAVVAAGLAGTLSGPGPFTVFAPTDAAFAALLTELGITKEQLLADTALLAEVLAYHAVDGRVLKADVPVGTPIVTLQGDTFTVGPTMSIADQRGRTSNITATDEATA